MSFLSLFRGSHSLRHRLDELLEHGGEDCPSFLVGRFQRGGDVASLGKEARQRRERVADSNGLHVGCWDVSADVGRHDQRLVGRRYERLVAEFVPNRLVNTLGVAGRRREKVHDEQIHSLIEDVGRFLDKGPDRGAAVLVAWRKDLDDGDDFPASMIKNDEEKVWMTPLLELRNELDNPDDRSLRDFRRTNGHVQLFHDRTIPGPYTKASREHWLRRVLEAQEQARGEGPPEFRNLRLITMDDLHEIRRIWLNEKHEFDDSLPRIFHEVTGQEFPRHDIDNNPLRTEDWTLLKEVCGEDEAFFDLQVRLLGIEQSHRGMSRRAGIFEKLESRFRSGFYRSEQEAVDDLTDRDRRTREAKDQAKGEMVPHPRVVEKQLGLLRDDLERLGE